MKRQTKARQIGRAIVSGATRLARRLNTTQFEMRNRFLTVSIRDKYSVPPRNLGTVFGELRANIGLDGKRILFVYPPKGIGLSSAYGEATPLALLHRLKEAKMDGWNAKIVNLGNAKDPVKALDQAVREHRPQIVGFSTTSASQAMSLSLAKHLHAKGLARGKLLVNGGPGTEYAFHEVNRVLGRKSPIDAFFLGDADSSFRPFLKAVETGHQSTARNIAGVAIPDGVKRAYRALEADISRRVFPDAVDIANMGEHAFPILLWSGKNKLGRVLFPNGRVSKQAAERMGRIQTMTKCAFGCSFCDVSALVGAQTRISPGEAIKQIRGMVNQGIRAFYFEDATFLVDKIRGGAFTRKRDSAGNVVPGQRFAGWTNEFLHEMKILKAEEEKKGNTIRFGIQTRIDSLDNDAIRQLAEAGCTNVFLGVETLSMPSLGRMHKGTKNLEGDLQRMFSQLNKNGINSTVSLIVGKYTGGIQNFEYTLKKMSQFGASEIFMQAAAIYPGTGDWKALEPAERSHVTLSYLAPGHSAGRVSTYRPNPEDQVQYNKWDWKIALRKYYKLAPRFLGPNFVRINPGHYLRREIYEALG